MGVGRVFVVVLDRFVPPSPPTVPSIQIEAKGKSTVTQAKLTRWHNESSLGLGLRSQDTVIDTSQVYAGGSPYQSGRKPRCGDPLKCSCGVSQLSTNLAARSSSTIAR